MTVGMRTLTTQLLLRTALMSITLAPFIIAVAIYFKPTETRHEAIKTCIQEVLHAPSESYTGLLEKCFRANGVYVSDSEFQYHVISLRTLNVSDYSN